MAGVRGEVTSVPARPPPFSGERSLRPSWHSLPPWLSPESRQITRRSGEVGRSSLHARAPTLPASNVLVAPPAPAPPLPSPPSSLPLLARSPLARSAPSAAALAAAALTSSPSSDASGGASPLILASIAFCAALRASLSAFFTASAACASAGDVRLAGGATAAASDEAAVLMRRRTFFSSLLIFFSKSSSSPLCNPPPTPIPFCSIACRCSSDISVSSSASCAAAARLAAFLPSLGAMPSVRAALAGQSRRACRRGKAGPAPTYAGVGAEVRAAGTPGCLGELNSAHRGQPRA